jgi:hypothetical protein
MINELRYRPLCRRSPLFLVALLTIATAILAAYPSSVRGQQAASATLSGVVKDPQGALVAGAQVIATHKTTESKRETVTNDEGLYVFTNLPVGVYSVKVQARGFKPAVYEDVNLQVGQSVRADFPLAIADVSETVCLDCGTDMRPLVDTDSSAVGDVITELEKDSLPLNGRNFLELALLIPGNSPAPNFDPTKTNSVVISSAGQLGRGGNITVDGADDNDDVVGGPLQNISQEAVQEFQIATNRFSAQLGRSGSSVINIVTKSGERIPRFGVLLFP